MARFAKRGGLLFAAVIVLFSIGFIAVNFSVLWDYFSPHTITVTIRNSADEQIRSVNVKTYGIDHQVGQIEIGKTTQIRFPVRSDGDYDVSVVFESGKSLHQTVGYLTNGMDFHDTLDIGNNRIDLANKQ